MKIFLFRSMIGIFFGAFIAVIFTNVFVLFSGKELLDSQMFLRNSLGSIFCGWFFTVSALYFENPNLRLSQQTLLHFVTVIILYFIFALGIGWVPFDLTSFFIAIATFLIFYAIIWTSFYLYFRRQMKKLNEELELL
ncbi:DUF3021 domain-containing protein [Psychrobacillus vulpis]|uniref:DUF3021 domain-containing protein n=1 Tax=Psychrobacillus vulpis TaxID=2325572 RepID=A0A544TVG1_9BACI|nr:DUF3021 domain-containing protein [Psychrobacillus vulpis]TQR21430.1 DUF3021 domain-containing protein [Psychrobacillus vulpis]